jgi:uncharacterized protein YndB with AHSA1/START domain
MAQYERSATIDAPPAATYDYLADPRHMPEYVATMTQARQSDRDHLHVAAEVEGRHEEGEAMFRSDPSSRRLEWGREGHAYRGWLTVGGVDDESTSRVTIHLETHDESDPAEIERTLEETLANIRNALSKP